MDDSIGKETRGANGASEPKKLPVNYVKDKAAKLNELAELDGYIRKLFDRFKAKTAGRSEGSPRSGRPGTADETADGQELRGDSEDEVEMTGSPG